MNCNEDLVFSPPLLNNYFGLEKFLSGKSEISSIRNLCINKKISNSYFTQWRIAWIVIKSPVDIVLSLFFKTLALLVNTLQFQKEAQIFTLISNHFLKDWEQLSDHWDLGIPILMPAYGKHQISNWDIYFQDPIPIESIEDERVLPLTSRHIQLEEKIRKCMNLFFETFDKDRQSQVSFSQKIRETLFHTPYMRKKITNIFINYYKKSPDIAINYFKEKFSQPYAKKSLQKLYYQLKKFDLYLAEYHKNISVFFSKGACRGACLWFIYLYLQTQHLNTTPQTHAISVASRFKTGIPRQAAIVNALDCSQEILKLKMTNMENQYISLFELDIDRDSILNKINSLKPGIYRVGTYRHSLVFIKNSDIESYVWNPDFGLFKMNSEQLLQMIFRYHYRPKNPDSHIYFHRYELT